MLGFRTKPDRVFLAIVDASIQFLFDHVDFVKDASGGFPNWWAEEFPQLATFSSPEFAWGTLAKLLEANKSGTLYQLTDYHWYLLYVAPQLFTNLQNDGLREEPSGLREIEPYMIGSIDFDYIFDCFFWDVDFDAGEVLVNLSQEQRRELGVSEAAWDFAARLKPHPDELALKVWNRDQRWEEDAEEYPEGEIISIHP